MPREVKPQLTVHLLGADEVAFGEAVARVAGAGARLPSVDELIGAAVDRAVLRVAGSDLVVVVER